MSDTKVIDFMGKRKIALIISTCLILASISSFFVKGFSLGLDFTGGTLVELKYDDTAELESIRGQLNSLGYPGASVVNFGTDRDVLIRFEQIDNPNAGAEVAKELIKNAQGNAQLMRVDFVGPQIGEELKNDGGIGMLFALAVVMVYVALRFQFKFSVGAVAALIHDVIIVLGIFSFFQLEFDLTVLAAVLAVIGYSLNDTIVVSDRIRENFRLMRKGTVEEIINESLTQTFGRTIITSLTTLAVLLALFFVGGALIHNFSSALIIGIIVGTYSSIYVAANVLIMMNISSEDLMPVVKEGEEFEDVEQLP